MARIGFRITIHYLQQLGTLGVRSRSYTEPYLSPENELVSHILLAVMSYFAKSEAKKISRRTKAGLERTREEGKQIGCPSKFSQYKDQLRTLQDARALKAEMKRKMGIAYDTVKSYLQRLDEGA